MAKEPVESLAENVRDPLMRTLNRSIVLAVKILAVLMVVIVFWALIDVLSDIYLQLTSSVHNALNPESLLDILGSVLAVLIAIEIFLNIVFFLKKDAIHVPLVLSTALTAVARKVIIFDYLKDQENYLYASAAVIFALGITYWLITKQNSNSFQSDK